MARRAGEQEDDLMTTPAKKCKIAFRDPLNTDTQRTEVA